MKTQRYTPAVIELAPMLAGGAIDDKFDAGASQRRLAELPYASRPILLGESMRYFALVMLILLRAPSASAQETSSTPHFSILASGGLLFPGNTSWKPGILVGGGAQYGPFCWFKGTLVSASLEGAFGQ